jgi:hypothetical protein
MKRLLFASSMVALGAVALASPYSVRAAVPNAQPVVLVGPTPVVLVAGVVARESPVATYRVAGQIVSSSLFRPENLGHQAVVLGNLLSDGTVRATSVVVGDAAVYGASPVLVTGIVTHVNHSVGLARIGGLWVDYTAALSSTPLLPVAVGALLQFIGTQPHMNGPVVAKWGRGVDTAALLADGANADTLQRLGVDLGTGRAMGIDTGMRTKGIDTGMRTKGIDTGMRTLGIDTGMRTKGIDTGMRTKGIDTGMRTLGIDTGMRTKGIDTGMRTKGIDTGMRTLGIDTGMRTLGIDTGMRARVVGAVVTQ